MNNLLTVYITDNITLSNLLLTLFMSLLIGICFSLVYILTKKKEGYSRSFIMALVVMPIIIAMIINLVSNDIVKVLSLGGIFTIMRFRTRISSVKDAAYLFSVVGLAFGVGFAYYKYVIIVGLFVLLVLSFLSIFKIDKKSPTEYRLKITVPETLDYTHLFDEVFDKYTKNHILKTVKVTDFGAMMDLTYFVNLKDNNDIKKFLDELRIKNGNLNIIISDDFEKMLVEEN